MTFKSTSNIWHIFSIPGLILVVKTISLCVLSIFIDIHQIWALKVESHCSTYMVSNNDVRSHDSHSRVSLVRSNITLRNSSTSDVKSCSFWNQDEDENSVIYVILAIHKAYRRSGLHPPPFFSLTKAGFLWQWLCTTQMSFMK